MRRTTLLLSCCLLLTLLFALRFSAAPLAVRINEKSTTLDLSAPQAVVTLPVENVSGRELAARITLELLDTKDAVEARHASRVELQTGRQSLRLTLPFNFKAMRPSDLNEFPLYRLRYSIVAEDSTGATTEGVISLSEIMPELFEMRVSAARRAREGMRYRVRVQATHPFTRRPVRGVQLTGEIELNEGSKDVVLQARATTDAEGNAALDFNLPAIIKDEDARINVTGRLNVFEQEASASIDFDTSARILLTVDKPLYQPGQTLHLRALVLDPTGRALPSASASFAIEDPDDTTVFRADSTTTRFGIATADWEIPENTRLGNYTIKVELEDGRFEDSFAAHVIKISRYDLPNFTVSAKADRPYYLPNQNAEVEIRADYLFGQPVKRGSVRLVRETERRWNFQAQKYETEEGQEIKGELDAEGRFKARINLQEEHEQLSEESYNRFRDVSYAAYLTDPTTNRTEQRRFNLRVTKEPIHIYVSEGSYDQTEGMPLAFYVSASYADGSPAQCEISVETEQSDEDASHSYGKDGQSTDATRTARLALVKTNRYGIAKVMGSPVASGNVSNRYLSVKLSARDRQGRTGHHVEGIWLRDSSVVRVETDKAIYKPGEPVRAVILSNKADAILAVDVVNNLKVVRSEAVRLENGRASITFPYGKEFDGILTIVATLYESQDSSYERDQFTGRRTILYPHDRELKLDVKVGQEVYRPGEDAEATLSASTADGRALESVFGVVIFDKAVEERARTDEEFSSNFGFYDYFRTFRYGTSMIAGIGLRELEQLDVKRKPVPEDLNALADMLLQYEYNDYELNSFESDAYRKNQASIFGEATRQRLEPVKRALDARYDKAAEYPANADTLRSFLRDAQIDFDTLRDPWGMPYQAVFTVDRATDVVEIVSAGADKQPGTYDDFGVLKFSWPYFRKLGERIDAAVNGYHARTGGFIRDEATLRAELARAGLGTEALIDRWGQPFRVEFGASGVLLSVRLKSGGADKRFDREYRYGSDDFAIWTTWVDSFSDIRSGIDRALNAYLQSTGKFPQDEASFQDALKRAGIERAQLLDPFGHPYLAGFKSESRNVDRVVFETSYGADGKEEKRSKIVPTSQRVFLIKLFSTGQDGRGDTGDDFNAAVFTSTSFEQTANNLNVQPLKPFTAYVGATGALTGTVVDATGAAIAGVSVTAVNTNTSAEYSAVTNDSGVYTLRDLPPGMYSVSMTAPGFALYRMEGVPVRSSTLIKVDATLSPAGVTETVTVTATADAPLNATSSSLSLVELKPGLAGKRATQLSTPRLREYFPETLVWQPALETDAQGRALVRFKLADNITTWKMSVIGSTADGEIGTAEKEIRAFQPFFVEHDPPRILTEGDEIGLPVVLRNYLDKTQVVELELKPESWFSLNGAAEKRSEVGAGDAQREVFTFRAMASVKDGKQRITARGEDASDAIEKPVTVHPDGEERATTDSRVFTDAATLDMDVPLEVIRPSLRGELKIYPSLVGHLFESIEGIMERPYGCGEQTISSTYPSLLLLRAYKRNGMEPSEKVGARARKYLRAGYERLLNYRAESGGFSYWGGDSDANLALTAYALRFLHDVEEFTEVDEDVADEARDWIIKAQRTDGSWPQYLEHDRSKEMGSAMATALIARTLALYEKKDAKASDTQAQKAAREALKRAFSFLDKQLEEVNEPYLIASYALASMDAGESERAARAVARLRRLALNEGDGSYWPLEGSTPFYGWGLAGRVETTALVLQALTRGGQSADEALTGRGLLYLLKQKDRYGVWYSTQATINVLDAMIALLPSSRGVQDNAPNEATVLVNGKPAGKVLLPPSIQLSAPLTVDISKFLSAGNNRVEIKRAGGARSSISAQVVANYYVPWARALADETRQRSAGQLKLTVNFNKTEAGVTEEVTCKVKAERVGSGGYGMLLAEVGLPPGADVDRASLERAMKESGWSFNRYDILPDRLVVYLWPRTGGTDFEFKLRPRFQLNALTAPSVLYDYYNPEAHTSLAPVRFLVR